MASAIESLARLTAREAEVTRLHDHEFRIGILTDVIEPDGQDTILACMSITCPHCSQQYDEVLEMPAELGEKLKALVGHRVNIAQLYGKTYAAEVDGA